jgi:hypothetical protein
MEAAASFLLLLPGPKMIWQFGELGYDFSINYCTNGTISEDCRTGSKPVRWDYYNNSDRRDLFEVYRKLIYLKKTQPVFRDLGHFMDVGGVRKVLRFTSTNFNSVIVGNFDVVGQTMNPGFPFGGIWYDYLTGDSLDVSNPGNAFNYEAGEYHVYTDRKITPPANTYLVIPDGIDDLHSDVNEVIAYPNPLQNTLNLRLPVNADKSTTVSISDISGRIVASPTNLNMNGVNEIKLNVSMLTSGIYFYTVQLKGNTYTGKLIKP